METNSSNAQESKLIADKLNLEQGTVQEVICLLEAQNTVPFIARYRKEQSKGLDPTVLRQVESLHLEQRDVRVKAEKTKKKIGENLTPVITQMLDLAQTSEEVDEIYAPFKSGNKKTHAARAKELGLEDVATKIFNNSAEKINLEYYVTPNKEGLKNLKEVTQGVQYILADNISKNKTCLDKLKELLERWPPVLNSAISSKVEKDPTLQKESEKYKNYHSFERSVTWLKAHQILAINRAESQKILTVKITLPAKVKDNFTAFAKYHFKADRGPNSNVFNDAIVDGYDRLIAPAACRRERSSLKKKAELESTKVFTQNLYSLLLTPPVKGKTVLALDPGYTNGCKMALVNPTGAVLETGLIFPTGRKANIQQARNEVVSLVKKHSCTTIAIGNGAACRETEMFITKLIQDDVFLPLDVVYCIVSEDGASVYSASEEAKAELPDLEISMRGAVSIGRRLQDPLVELIKIEPKHLGIGMYQHDIPEKMLRTALEGVLVDCVSLVGVDINTANVHTLKHIAGLNEKKALSIIEWRERNKRFKNRTQIQHVKGIGKKSYEQCVGFLKVIPEYQSQMSNIETIVVSSDDNEKTVLISSNDDDDDDDDSEDSDYAVSLGSKRRRRPVKRRGASKRVKAFGYNHLDSTLIHPESYDMAERLMKKMAVHSSEIGTPAMKQGVSKLLTETSFENLANEFHVDKSTTELIIDGLQTPLDFDIRSGFEKPIFKKGLMIFEDLYTGLSITGRVTNVTTFGAFVDCGVGRDGLIHESRMGKRSEPLAAGDVVEVTVINIVKDKRQFQLKLDGVRPRLKAQLLTTNRIT